MNRDCQHRYFKNWFRHFFVACGALALLVAVGVLLYQYAGMALDLPGVFLKRMPLADQSWKMDIDHRHPMLLASVGIVLFAAAAYATFQRKDFGEYRESETESQSGF